MPTLPTGRNHFNMEEKLKPLKTIHIGLCLGVALIYFLIGDLQHLDFLNVPEVDTTTYIFLFIPVAAIFLGKMLYRQLIKTADKKLPLESHVGVYQTALLIRWGMLEGAALLLLFLKKELLLIGLFLIIYMMFLWPSADRMKKDFQMIGA